MSLPRGIRLNNPGNIVKSPNAWKGKVDGPDERFESFETPFYGYRAMASLLRIYWTKHGLNRVSAIINRWAPATENDVDAYAKSVASYMSVRPDTTLDMDYWGTVAFMVRAMSIHENGRNKDRVDGLWHDPKLIDDAVKDAYGIKPDSPLYKPLADNPPQPASVPDIPAQSIAPDAGRAPTLLERNRMGPFVLPAIEALASLIPSIGKLFGSGSEVAKRNVEAGTVLAEKVLEIAKEATGARNEQEVVEMVRADPSKLQAVETAVQAQWFDLVSSPEQTKSAREFNLQAAHFWTMPAFWITVLLLPLLYLTVYQVLAGTGFSPEVKASVATAVVSMILGGVLGFWLGSSFTTSRSGLNAQPERR